jgi:hypothetical protein
MRKYQAALFVLLMACGGNDQERLGIEHVDELIHRHARERATPALAYHCPPGASLDPGSRFECDVEMAGGTHAIVVEVRNRWDLRAWWKEPMAAGGFLEERILANAPAFVAGVYCGDQIATATRPAVCAADGGGVFPDAIEAWIEHDDVAVMYPEGVSVEPPRIARGDSTGGE